MFLTKITWFLLSVVTTLPPLLPLCVLCIYVEGEGGGARRRKRAPICDITFPLNLRTKLQSGFRLNFVSRLYANMPIFGMNYNFVHICPTATFHEVSIRLCNFSQNCSWYKRYRTDGHYNTQISLTHFYESGYIIKDLNTQNEVQLQFMSAKLHLHL
jgi:hypothetical protein